MLPKALDFSQNGGVLHASEALGALVLWGLGFFLEPPPHLSFDLFFINEASLERIFLL